MYKPLLLASVLLAQALPPIGTPAPMMPVRPASTTDISDGITVSGTGYATTQATQATLTLHISTRNGTMSLDSQTLEPIVDALVRAGVDRSSIQIPSYLVGNARTNNASVVASVQHPSLPMLQQGMVILASAFAAAPNLLLNNAEVRLSVDDCGAVHQEATANSIANARRTAEFIAKQIHAHVGDVLAVDDRTAPLGLQGACSTMYSIGPYGPPAPQLADMLTVRTYANVSMRFAIRR